MNASLQWGGNTMRFCAFLLCFLAMWAVTAGAQEIELKHYPLDDVSGLITQSDVLIDENVPSEGKGSLKATASQPRVVRLFETGDLGIDNARLIYRARLKTEDIKGQAYLEMWCHFPGKGEFFSRGLQNPLSGTNNWVTEEIPFLLQKGERPDNVKLNLVINGTGTVWIDDIRILRAPLQ
jgi:hypothetical protein